jgi:Heliorhodopsin
MTSMDFVDSAVDADEARQPSMDSEVSVVAAAASRLRRFNVVAALLHGAQAAAVLALTNARSLPVTAAYGNGPPGQPQGPVILERLFSYRIGWAVALFLILSSAFHLLVASPWGTTRYADELSHHRNRFRWLEYSLSASLMIVLIAGIVGITDVAALIALFAVNASMILFGWLTETTSAPRSANWTPFVFGCIAGVAPWIAITIYLIGAGSDVPGFVYGIFVSLFVLFNSFAVNQWLQYRGRGRWAQYLFGERIYIVLSLVAKSLLAWQIFANVLTPT